MTDSQGSVSRLIQDVSVAVQSVQEDLSKVSLAISRVDLEIKTSLQKITGGSGKLEILIPVELSVHKSCNNVQTLSLTFIPEPALELMGTVANELTESVRLITAAIQEFVVQLQAFRLREAVVSIQISMGKDGKIAVLAGAQSTQDLVHTVRLTIANCE
jgi:hypothetical protein